MQANGRGHGRAALAATTLAVTLTAATGGASAALTVPELPVQPPEVPTLPALPDLPTAPAPSVPEVTAPEVTAPEAPSTPSLRSTPSLPSGGEATGGSAPATGAAPAADGSVSNSRTPEATPDSGGAETSAVVSGPQAQAMVRRSRRERRFRRAARRLEPCLFALAGFERRVIVLRAGYGGRRPLSRSRVARRLGASVRRVRAAERRGLRTLRTTNRAHGCLGSSAPAVAVLAAPGAAPPLVDATGDGAVRLVAAATRARSPAALRVQRAKRGGGGVLSAQAAGGSAPPRATIRPVADNSQRAPLGLIAGLVVLVLVAVVLSTAVLLRRRPDVAAPAPAAVAPPAPVEEPPAVATEPEVPPTPAAPPAAPRPVATPPPPSDQPQASLSPRRRAAVGLAASAVSIAAGFVLRRRRR